MQGGEVVLSVDCGTVGTSAVVVGADGGWAAVRFNSGDGLPSAVFRQADGSWLTGQRAWQARPQAPDRFEASPVARLREDRFVLGGVPVESVELVAATLRTVAAGAATRLGGAPVGEVRLVVPPGSGPRWRAALWEAAGRAGLGQPVLVEAPAAAAAQVVATGAPVVVGSFLLVCDWGGGFTASVLRRTRFGFEVLSTIDTADAGGRGLDQAIAAHLAGLAGSPEPAQGDVGWSVTARWAREALGRVPAVTVQVPPVGAVLVTWEQVGECLRPVVARAAKTAHAAVEAAEVPAEQLAGVFCVGGVAQAPAMVDLLRQETGLPVVAPQDAGRAAVLGAAKATGPSLDTPSPTPNEPPLPRWRQLVAAVVPGLASQVLFWHFALSASLHRAGGIGYDPNAYLLADWGELALAALFALLACLGSAVVIAAVIPVDNELGESAGVDGYSSRMSTGLLAACGLGLSVAAVYGIFGAVVLQWSNTPFLRWALLPLLPITATVAVTAWWVARWGRAPADGWHQWLNYPAWSVVVAAVGMVAAQTGLTAPRYPADEPLLGLFAHAGAALIAVAAVMVLLRRWRYRLILALPLAVVAAGIVAPSTTGVLATVYVIAATGWWGARAWQLATRPRGSLPHPAQPGVRP